MNTLVFDNTFEGLLTAVFESFALKITPTHVLPTTEQPTLFSNETLIIETDLAKSERVWSALEKKLSPSACTMLNNVFLADEPEVSSLLFRYICKAFNNKKSIELNFADADVLRASQLYKIIRKEAERVLQFVRFQKTNDGIFFAPVTPQHDVLPLTVEHFVDRFADQQWIIYDTKRNYGFFYNLKSIEEVTFTDLQMNILSGKLNEDILAEDEKMFQQMWKAYFKSMTIKERRNLKLHRQHLPKKYWKYLPEKQ